MKRPLILSVSLILLLISCATPTYMIDNSRVKFQDFDEMTVTAIALQKRGDSEIDLVALLAEVTPQIAVITADKKTIAEIVDLIPMNVVKISSTRIIATTGVIDSKSDAGAVISFSDAYMLQVLIDSDDHWTGPVLVAGSQRPEGFDDIFKQTHAGSESLPFTIYQKGLLPLNSTDIRDTYVGYDGIICSFALSD